MRVVVLRKFKVKVHPLAMAIPMIWGNQPDPIVFVSGLLEIEVQPGTTLEVPDDQAFEMEAREYPLAVRTDGKMVALWANGERVLVQGDTLLMLSTIMKEQGPPKSLGWRNTQP
jgi:hypothetical protein